jgi:hypothetical protein
MEEPPPQASRGPPGHQGQGQPGPGQQGQGQPGILNQVRSAVATVVTYLILQAATEIAAGNSTTEQPDRPAGPPPRQQETWAPNRPGRSPERSPSRNPFSSSSDNSSSDEDEQVRVVTRRVCPACTTPPPPPSPARFTLGHAAALLTDLALNVST